MDDLLLRQENLQKEAQQQVVALGLVEMLSPFGQVQIVGSVVTGLMTWPDVDMEVIVTQMPSKETIGELGKKIFSYDNVIRVWLMDNRDKQEIHQPAGIYLGGKRRVGETIWKFDMWFILGGDRRSGKDDVAWVKAALTPEKRLAILQIKDQIANNPKYRKSIFSIDIYQAVLQESATSLSDFEKYLNKSGRTLTP